MDVVLSDATNDPVPESVNESLLAGPLDLGRQTRNLLLARPLHELAAKVRRADYGDGEFQDIDTHYLALAMFDFIMEGSVFGLGRLREEVTSYLAEVVRQMKPALGEDRCNQLALEILNSLHNTDNRNEQFDFPYYDVASATTRSYRFSLLTFERQDDNQYKYRLTEAAILLYVGQLDIGAEQMQTLLDRMTAELVKRGRVNEALDVSRQAYLQAVRYQDSIRTRLDRAQRVPDAISWKQDLEPFIEESREHIDERGKEERSLLGLVKEKINNTSDRITRERLVRLCETVEREADIHLHLLRLVAQAGEKYLEASRTMFRARQRHRLPDMEDRVLPQLLKLPQASLTQVAQRGWHVLLPPNVERVFNLRQVIELLTEPQAEPPVRSDDPDIIKPIPEEVPHFGPEVVREGNRYLKLTFGAGRPVFIDEVLEKAEADGLDAVVRDYLVFMMYQSFSREEDIFGVDAQPQGRFNLPRVEGSRLLFTPRDTHDEQ
ncbi:hypothetical protein [Paraburkholderia pallida]|uniref:Uncharacterized protein n=1 Tax=Paraburkholderia pallida TaxID=2547399 RepID=A0A4P7D6J9_9BURK|nr:hypothetical protein [Paraburkholderia pallida]QBR02475.1 hypothetical protein E1956_35085 [Paraburkholderia pallida]